MNKSIQVTTELQHFTNNTAKQQQQNWSLAWYWSPHTYSYDLRHKNFRQIFETEMSRALAIACTLHDGQVTFSLWEWQCLRHFFETKTFCIDKYLSHPGNGGDDPHQPEDGGEEDHCCLSPCHLFIHHNHSHYSRHPCVVIITIIHPSSAQNPDHWTFTMLGMSQAKGEAAVLTTDPTWVVWDLEFVPFCVVQHCFDYERLEWLWRRKERPDSTSRQGKRLELASMCAEIRQLESEVRCSQSPSLVTSTAVHWQLR